MLRISISPVFVADLLRALQQLKLPILFYFLGYSSYRFAVNRLPDKTESDCEPSPERGMAVRDKFNIKCRGKFKDDDLPLTYKIAYRVDKMDKERIWVYAGTLNF